MKKTATVVCLTAAMLLAGSLPGSAWAAAPAADNPPPEVSGMLQMQLWVMFATDVPSKPYANDIFARHIAHQVELEKSGVMFAAGPLIDIKGQRELGMIIIRANSAEQAKVIADSDPMYQEGYRTYTLHRWRLNEGHLNLAIDYSTGKATIR
jgi:uncharacterized protein